MSRWADGPWAVSAATYPDPVLVGDFKFFFSASSAISACYVDILDNVQQGAHSGIVRARFNRYKANYSYTGTLMLRMYDGSGSNDVGVMGTETIISSPVGSPTELVECVWDVSTFQDASRGAQYLYIYQGAGFPAQWFMPASVEPPPSSSPPPRGPFCDTFERSDRALDGDNGWQQIAAANTGMGIVGGKALITTFPPLEPADTADYGIYYGLTSPRSGILREDAPALVDGLWRASVLVDHVQVPEDPGGDNAELALVVCGDGSDAAYSKGVSLYISPNGWMYISQWDPEFMDYVFLNSTYGINLLTSPPGTTVKYELTYNPTTHEIKAYENGVEKLSEFYWTDSHHSMPVLGTKSGFITSRLSYYWGDNGGGDYYEVLEYGECVAAPRPKVDTSGQLGIGEYRILITDRCGGRSICDVTEQIGALTYSRLMDDTSEAQVVVNFSADSEDAGCCACLGDVRTWIHSFEVYRNGDLVWGPGPVYNILYRKNSVTITARDVSAWLDVRVVHNEYTKALGTDFVKQPVDYIVRTILTDALSGGPDTPDDPCGLVRYLDIGEIPDLFDKEASIADGYAGDILRDLARSLLDYTVLGNRMLVRKQLVFGPYARLRDEDFQTELEVEERGAEAGSKWYVNGNGVYGSCGGEPVDIQYIGLVEQVDVEDQITDLDAVKTAACSRKQGSNPAPLYVNIPDGAKLSPSAGVTMRQLVPGTLIDLSLRELCREVTVRQRLTAVHVTVAGGDEAVGITLSPLGTGFGEAGGAVSRPQIR